MSGRSLPVRSDHAALLLDMKAVKTNEGEKMDTFFIQSPPRPSFTSWGVYFVETNSIIAIISPLYQKTTH